MTTELAWSWLRFQPDSALSVWFRERFGGGGKRLRRIGIVAVARKLLIALWRFLETGGGDRKFKRSWMSRSAASTVRNGTCS